jgi:glycosyltransferase involved in cell wall biosynthesis
MPGEKLPVVVFINHWARHLGGAEHSLTDILAAIALRCQAHLITAEPGPLVEKAAELGITCHRISCRLKPGGKGRGRMLWAFFTAWPGLISFFWFVIRTSALVRRLSPVCIHANVPKSHVTLFMLSALGYRGGCWFHMREIFKKGSAPYSLYRLLFPQKRGNCIAISQAVYSRMPPCMQKKSTVIYNGVAIPPAIVRTSDNKDLRCIYLGRVVPWKGCHRLIAMFAQANKKYFNIKLTIMGDTLYWSQDYRRKLCDQIADLSLESSCFLLPHTQTPLRELGEHHVFCNASFEEPFGRSVAEAQAAGLPVIAFDSGAIREIVVSGETGFLAPFGDGAGFIQALGKFIENPALIARMGKAGNERARRFFNRDVQIPLICGHLLNP